MLQTVQKKNNNSNLHIDRQCKKNNNSNLHIDRQCKKNYSNLHMDRQCKKKKNYNNLHMDRQCKKKLQQFTYFYIYNLQFIFKFTIYIPDMQGPGQYKKMQIRVEFIQPIKALALLCSNNINYLKTVKLNIALHKNKIN